MNIDDFLDSVEGNSSTSQSTSQTPVVVRDDTPNNSQSAVDPITSKLTFAQYGWDGAVTDVSTRISQCIASGNYSTALDFYMQLKELPSLIVEADMRTQERLKEEILKAHEQILSHMKEQETKHTSSSEKIKQLILLSFEELTQGREEVASGLYVKACQLYGQLPTEFKERNVKLHYDLLKVYFKIKEFHDIHEHQVHEQFLRTFNAEYQRALDVMQQDLGASKEIQQVLHDKVLLLPNEEVQLKSKLLERLVRLRTQISYQEHRLALVHNTDAVNAKVAAGLSTASKASAPSASKKPDVTISTQVQRAPRNDSKDTGSAISHSQNQQADKPEVAPVSQNEIPSFAQIGGSMVGNGKVVSQSQSHNFEKSAGVQPLAHRPTQMHHNNQPERGSHSVQRDEEVPMVPLQFAGTQSDYDQYAYDSHYAQNPQRSQSADYVDSHDSDFEAELASRKYRGFAPSVPTRQTQGREEILSTSPSSYASTYADEDEVSDVQRRIRDVFKSGTFAKSISPLPPSKIIAQTQAAQSAGMVVSSPIADDDIDTIMSQESAEVIQKLRSLSRKQTQVVPVERLDDLQLRAEKIKQKLRDLHGDM
jgi:hypothetical protein